MVTQGLSSLSSEAPHSLAANSAWAQSIRLAALDTRLATRILVARLRYDRAVNQQQRGELQRHLSQGTAQLARLKALREDLEAGRSDWATKLPRPVWGGGAPSRTIFCTSEEADVAQLHRHYAATRDTKAQLELLDLYDRFALDLARRFSSRREQPEDLGQVARIGLLKALDRFDPERERPFPLFARPTIVGELKRHIRDRTWSMRVPRALQERYLAVVQTADPLTQELGRWPRIDEVAALSGLSDEQVLEAMELGSAQHMMSLDAPPPEEDGPLSFDFGGDDAAYSGVERRALLGALMSRIPPREREILRLRFELELTQTEIADRLGVSQMYISRLLARTLARLRVLAREPVR